MNTFQIRWISDLFTARIFPMALLGFFSPTPMTFRFFSAICPLTVGLKRCPLLQFSSTNWPNRHIRYFEQSLPCARVCPSAHWPLLGGSDQNLFLFPLGPLITFALATHAVAASSAHKCHSVLTDELVPFPALALPGVPTLLPSFLNAFHALCWCARITDQFEFYSNSLWHFVT